MRPHFYHRMEADYLKKVKIWRLKRKGWLKIGNTYSITIEWKHDENRSGLRLEVSLLSDVDRKIKSQDIDKYARFTYTQTDQEGNKNEFDYKVPLTTTLCNFGGCRYWFICLFCQRRVGVLYKRGDYFACRHCQYLTYESRNLSGRWKWAGKIISEPEIEALRKEVKRISYNGRPTRKLKRYLRKKKKFQEIYYRNVYLLQTISS